MLVVIVCIIGFGVAAVVIVGTVNQWLIERACDRTVAYIELHKQIDRAAIDYSFDRAKREMDEARFRLF